MLYAFASCCITLRGDIVLGMRYKPHFLCLNTGRADAGFERS
jgi:hypothetical protein